MKYISKKILYRATGENSKEECQNYLEKWVLPVDSEAEIEQDNVDKGESWIVLGSKKITRKQTVVEPR